MRWRERKKVMDGFVSSHGMFSFSDLSLTQTGLGWAWDRFRGVGAKQAEVHHLTPIIYNTATTYPIIYNTATTSLIIYNIATSSSIISYNTADTTTNNINNKLESTHVKEMLIVCVSFGVQKSFISSYFHKLKKKWLPFFKG